MATNDLCHYGKANLWAAFVLLATAAALLCAPPAVAGAPFTFSSTGNLAQGRTLHTTTLLQNGKVLVAGGANPSIVGTTELYDPLIGTWAATGNLVTPREAHTATMLPNGAVLVTGGVGASNTVLTTAELYDPATGKWKATGSLASARYAHTATLLPNGKVLVAGGYATNGFQGTAELYDPVTGTWTATGSLVTARDNHTATLLSNGKVLVVGGQGNVTGGTLNTAELYDPASGMWAFTGNLGNARYFHTATLLPSGKVLVADGQNGGAVGTAELYNPASGTWNTTPNPVNSRYSHTATLLPNGMVLVAGGTDGTNSLASAELYSPGQGANGAWTATADLVTPRSNQTATLLPTGSILFSAGFDGFQKIQSAKYLTSAELYDPASSGAWGSPPVMAAPREEHTATMLANGHVLVAGGINGSGALASGELFDVAQEQWTATGNLNTARYSHTATSLPNGKVLVAGGFDNSNAVLASAELYDPASGTWRATTSNLGAARADHTATLLPNGQVLVAAGRDSSLQTISISAELYNPTNGNWTATNNLNTARQNHTATLLSNGKVLVAGGYDRSLNVSASAEVYDPATGNWTVTNNLNTARYNHTATLLSNGKVLIAGGSVNVADEGSGELASAELYDPASGTWTVTGSLAAARDLTVATLLPNGKVLIACGQGNNTGPLASAEIYDPGSGKWTSAGNLNIARQGHTATLVSDDIVLVTGGANAEYLQSVELYLGGLGYLRSLWQPQIATAPSILPLGGSLALTGSLFQGISQASGGNTQDSSTSYPIAQLRNIETTQTTFLPVDPTAGWSGTAFTSNPVTGFPLGPAMVTVFANGIPSASSYVMVSQATPTLSSQASPATTLGNPINDIAILASGYSPTGSITFKAYGPNDGTCGAAPAFSSTVAVNNGNGNYSSGFTPTAVGTYRFVASYSGDVNNNPVTTSCSDPNAAVTVSPVPTPTPTPIPTATPTATPTASPTPSPGLVGNVSTRLPVGTGDNVLIEGFIVQGPVGSTKKIIVRAIGPSLAPFGITDALADPTLEIHDATNAIIAINDNWRTTQVGGIITADQVADISASQLAPSNDLESAIIANLAPGSYTAVVRGAGNTVGTGVVDAYDLSAGSPAKLANIATRGLIQPGDKLMIAGFIIQNGSVRAVVRAIGPSLSAFGITNALADTTLQLRDNNGAIVVENDDWKIRTDGSSQQAELEATGLQPTNDLEAAFLITLQPGQYTAQVRGKPEATGIGVVQVYFLQ